MTEPLSLSLSLSGSSEPIPGRRRPHLAASRSCARISPRPPRGSARPAAARRLPRGSPPARLSELPPPRLLCSRLLSPGPHRGTRRKQRLSAPIQRPPPPHPRSARPGSSARRRRRRPACIRARGGSARPCCSGTPPACAAPSRLVRVARSPRRCSDPGPRPRDCRRRPRAPGDRVPEQ